MSEPTSSGATSPAADHPSVGEEDKSEPPPRKRQRVRLSCLECRRRKLSCDRGFPCERCLKSGTPERCNYETRPGLAPPAKNGLSQGSLSSFDSRLSLPANPADMTLYRRDSPREHDRIRRLELEVAQLKNLLSKQIPSDGSTTLNEDSPDKADVREDVANQSPAPVYVPQDDNPCSDKDELHFFRGKEYKTRYFGPHNVRMAFGELTGLCPFMKETAEEWLRPLHARDPKDRGKRKKDREEKFAQPDLQLESLLPPKEDMDALVSIYLDQFEQIHRIVHIPSFRRDYAAYWEPGGRRPAAFTALLLAMIAVSSCLRGNLTGKFDGMVSHSHAMAEKWIKACDDWSQRQSEKHRKLIHYQIACMAYLAKRVNTVKKKRFWKGSGALVQDSVSVGLHRETTYMKDHVSAFNQEMRRRLWATIQEFDMQACFDHGFPSILGTLRFDAEPPRNLDDDDLDEDTRELPPSAPRDSYTYSSYQHISRQSLPLRLQLTRVLNGPPEELDYEQVIRYTNEITQEIDSLPSWDVGPGNEAGGGRSPLLAYTLLHIQLRQYIVPLHQPYLKLRKTNSKYQYSEIVYFNAARDMVLLHDKLAEQGIRTLNFLREDALTLAINLCSVTMLQPKGSTNMIMVNAQNTLRLLEKCLAMKEDRILRCGNNEPWAYSIMCAAAGLLETHLGEKTSEAAKVSSAERFINLHYKLYASQEPPPSSSNSGQMQVKVPPPFEVPDRPKSVTPFLPASQGSNPGINPADAPPTPWWIAGGDATMQPPAVANPDFSLEALGINLNELWGDYSMEDYS